MVKMKRITWEMIKNMSDKEMQMLPPIQGGDSPAIVAAAMGANSIARTKLSPYTSNRATNNGVGRSGVRRGGLPTSNNKSLEELLTSKGIDIKPFFERALEGREITPDYSSFLFNQIQSGATSLPTLRSFNYLNNAFNGRGGLFGAFPWGTKDIMRTGLNSNSLGLLQRDGGLF